MRSTGGIVGQVCAVVFASFAMSTSALALPDDMDGDPPFRRGPDRVLFTWSGRVDREVFIEVRGPELREGGIDGWLPSRARVNAPLPRSTGVVLLRVEEGRGYVEVVEQPSPWNRWTAVVRILDPRGGSDGYRFTAFWDDAVGGYGRGEEIWDSRWGGRAPWWGARVDILLNPRVVVRGGPVIIRRGDGRDEWRGDRRDDWRDDRRDVWRDDRRGDGREDRRDDRGDQWRDNRRDARRDDGRDDRRGDGRDRNEGRTAKPREEGRPDNPRPDTPRPDTARSGGDGRRGGGRPPL